jgi:hypothetical protein
MLIDLLAPSGIAMEAFQYHPLDLAKSQIRLFRITNSIEGNVSCDIEIFDLDSCPSYEALSYAWGPNHPKRVIFLNGRTFQVCENLFHFLENVRRRCISSAIAQPVLYEPSHLWVDQICIDQRSDTEKSHKVRRMKDIYQQADRVLSWLGQTSKTIRPGASILFAFLNNFNQGATISKEAKLPDIAYDVITECLNRPYWTRLWVMQEFMLAQKIALIVGDCLIDWETVLLIWN